MHCLATEVLASSVVVSQGLPASRYLICFLFFLKLLRVAKQVCSSLHPLLNTPVGLAQLKRGTCRNHVFYTRVYWINYNRSISHNRLSPSNQATLPITYCSISIEGEKNHQKASWSSQDMTRGLLNSNHNVLTCKTTAQNKHTVIKQLRRHDTPWYLTAHGKNLFPLLGMTHALPECKDAHTCLPIPHPMPQTCAHVPVICMFQNSVHAHVCASMFIKRNCSGLDLRTPAHICQNPGAVLGVCLPAGSQEDSFPGP